MKVNDPENRKLTLKVLDVESPDGETEKYYTLTSEKYTQDFSELCETAGYIPPLCEAEKSRFESTGFVKSVNGNSYFVGGTIGGCGDDSEGWDSYVREQRQYLYDNLTKL